MKYRQIIDLVRTFCVVAVLGVHAYVNLPIPNRWVCWFWGRFCTNGIYGVFLFFVVSGFLITGVIARNDGQLFKPDFRKFYVQRFGRIGPLFILCFISGLFIFLAVSPGTRMYLDFFPTGVRHGFWFWFSIPTFLFNWFLVFSPNWGYSVHWAILWSVAIEEQFYFLYPVALKRLGIEKKLLIFSLLAVLFAILWRTVFYFHLPDNGFIQSYASPAKFDLIAIGVLLYLAVQRFGPFLAKSKKMSALLCAGGLVAMLGSYFGSRQNDRFEEIMVPEILGLGLSAFLLGGFSLSFFESRFLRVFALPGRYCYGCYLLHPVVLFFIRPFLNRMDVFGGFLFFVALTTAVAALSYHFFEEPSNRMIRRTLGGLSKTYAQ